MSSVDPASPSKIHEEIHALHTKVHRARDFFPGQRASEIVQLFIRRHWILEFKIFLRFLFFAIIMPVAIFYGISFIRLDDTIWQWLYFNYLFYLLSIWLYTFIEFLKNELSVLVISNERIVDIIQTSLFSRQVLETNLNKIQDVIGTTSGLLGTFFDVGDLEIQTASRDTGFTTQGIKSPHLTARKILDVQRQSAQRRRGSDVSTQTSTVGRRPNDNLSDTEIQRLRSGGESLPITPLGRREENDQI